MIDILLSLGGFCVAVLIGRVVLEGYTEARRAWFFWRTRRHVEREWREYYDQHAQQAIERERNRGRR